MFKEELIKACEMRANGYTFQEIGDSLGYTRQHIHQAMKEMLNNHNHKISSKTIYPNLEREIRVKYKTITAFAKNIGFKYRRICDVLDGKARLLFDEAILISEYFNKDISYLFDKKELKG